MNLESFREILLSSRVTRSNSYFWKWVAFIYTSSRSLYWKLSNCFFELPSSESNLHLHLYKSLLCIFDRVKSFTSWISTQNYKITLTNSDLKKCLSARSTIFLPERTHSLHLTPTDPKFVDRFQKHTEGGRENQRSNREKKGGGERMSKGGREQRNSIEVEPRGERRHRSVTNVT